uniref:High-affinity branched-chain amino acid tansporter, ATP-binding protein n=1 Tax=Comamonas testosteroni TaxID=285 RepID=G9C9E5_COMTE|nr:ATP-binding cassette domain-containing protein [Comamonas testosteroni]AEX00410.1 high-affinity branched-chain amino acid tansporter, ATP-binding protein [Comamonas testosteroni]
MSATVVFAAHGLVKRFGGLTVTNDVSLQVREREIHALIGPNGAGKSTLVHMLSGLLRPEAGRIELQGRDISSMPPHRRASLGLGRCFQITSIFRDSTVSDNLYLALQCQRGASLRFSRSRQFEDAIAADVVTLARRVDLHRELDRIAGTLPHGAQRRLDLALALAGKPKVLLLDEPMAGMGPEESSQLVELIRDLRDEAAILLIEHDMDAVFRLADRVTVLVQGRIHTTGTPSEIRSNSEVQSVYLGLEATA